MKVDQTNYTECQKKIDQTFTSSPKEKNNILLSSNVSKFLLTHFASSSDALKDSGFNILFTLQKNINNIIKTMEKGILLEL